MKLFPVIAVVALHAVVALDQDSNEDPLSGMSFGEYMTKNGRMEPWPESYAESTLGSGSMEGESFADHVAAIIYSMEDWSAKETKAMNDWVEPNSVEFKTFQKKMNETDALVADIKKLPEAEDSMAALESIKSQLLKKTDEIKALVYDNVKMVSDKMDKEGSLTTEQFFDSIYVMSLNTVSTSGSDSMSTEASDEGSITQTSADSTTQSTSSFQKA